MPVCKTCGKKFHACGGCGLSNNYEYEFCNSICWKTSQEYSEAKKKFINLYNTLSQKQKEDFIELLSLDSDYEYQIEDWIKEQQ